MFDRSENGLLLTLRHRNAGRSTTKAAYLLALVFLSLPWLSRTAGATAVTCNPADPTGNAALLCTGDPCTISGSFEPSDGCVFDFGSSAVVVQSATIDAGGGDMSFLGGSLDIKSSGTLLSKGDAATSGGDITIDMTGPVTVGGTMEVSGNPGAAGGGGLPRGSVFLRGTEMSIGGSLIADGIGLSSDGGEITIEGSGSIDVTGTLRAQGNSGGIGGSVYLTGGHNVTTRKPIRVTGGDGGGGDITLEAGDHITTLETLVAKATDGAGSGGDISLAAGLDVLPGNLEPGGTITVSDDIAADGIGSGTGENIDCGDGGFVTLEALGDITILGNAPITAKGGAPDCFGGNVEITSADFQPDEIGPLDGSITLASKIEALGGGAEGFGGSVMLVAGLDATAQKPIDASANYQGGVITVEAGRHVTLNGKVLADAAGFSEGEGFGTEGFGGEIEITAGMSALGTLTVTDTVSADGGPLGTFTVGGTISLAGCGTSVNPGVKLRVRGGNLLDGGGGDIDIAALQSLAIGNNAELLAQHDGTITLTYFAGTPPVIGSGVLFDPGADQFETSDIEAFPLCPFCGNGRLDAGEECDEGDATDTCCDSSSCTFKAAGASCGAGLCGSGECDAAGSCVVSDPITCPDDGNVCNGPESCDPSTGSCASGPPAAAATPCDADSDLCTIDKCNGSGSCVFVSSVSCPDDGAVCNGPEACDPSTGACASGPPAAAGTVCEADANLCTTDECDGSGSCALVSSVSCPDDGVVCNGPEACDPSTGACASGPPAVAGTACDADGDACTDDECDGLGACQFVAPVPAICGDGCVSATEECDPAASSTGCGSGITCGAPGSGSECTCGAATSEICDNCVDDNANGEVDRDDPGCPGRADGAGAGLGDPKGRGKAAVNCEKAIKKAGGKFAQKKLKGLQKCVDAVFKCLQEKPGDGKCLEKAREKCAKEAAKIRAGEKSEEAKLQAAIEKGCGPKKPGEPPRVTPADLLATAGLGYSAEAVPCSDFGVTPLDSLAAIIDCILSQHECRVEQILSKEVPRARELLQLGGLDPADYPCLEAGADGAGAGLGDPKGSGKAAVKCQAAIKKAGARFTSKKIKAIQKCVNAIHACIQRKPGDAKCLDKAKATCTKEIGKLTDPEKGEESKLLAAVLKACESDDLTPVDLLAASGIGFEAHAAQCAELGVGSLASAADIAECVKRQHECRVEQMLQREVPRLRELLGIGEVSLP